MFVMVYPGSKFNQIASRLREDFRGIKLLALGQTVYWDEPLKAILRRLLDEYFPEAEMLVGIHDADYFSKIPTALNLPEGWHILSHNDGSTKDLWVATGEISRLFGSETIPARDMLVSHGVQLDRIARDYPGGRDLLIDTATKAWGWRGLTHVDSGNEISCCITLKDSLPHLLGLLEWGFGRTLDSLSDADAIRGKRIADELLSEVKSYAELHPDASVPDMFREILYHFYERLLGYKPRNLGLTSISEVFTFNKSTANLPRFNLLGAFLNQELRAKCQEAYDLAVQGSDIYTLDRFPEGAIPFDLVVPCKGRGTICLRDGNVVIDLDEPVSLPCKVLPSTPGELAELIEANFGPNVALVGKALTLVLMMASEFIFVLHEEASAYVPRCEKMAALMSERGATMPFNPILRIDCHTWDSLEACEATFNLPGHLGSAFRQGEITSREFADSWRNTVDEQEQLLNRIAELNGTEELLNFLAEYQSEPWPSRIEAYKAAYHIVREMSERTEPMKLESVQLRDLSHQIKQEVQQLEADKGEHFRTNIKPLKDELWQYEADGSASGDEAANLSKRLQEQEAIREGIQAQIELKREEALEANRKSFELKNAVKLLEKSEDIEKARQKIKIIEYEAELARLWLVRDAFIVSRGLSYLDHRPSAWWFLLADPEMKWFNRVAQTAEFRFEEINP